MKVACERCNRVMDIDFERHKIVKLMKEKDGIKSTMLLCEKCSNLLDSFLYEGDKDEAD